ncbi:MAG: hypothetical protein VX231_07430 [Pseudomonadota bacterium]|nr:hypothetical protein [Pseudomonadota bacterium]
MTISSWDPNEKKTSANDQVDTELLACFIAATKKLPCELDTILPSEQLQQSQIIQASASAWQTAIAEFSNEELVLLIQFFTVIEAQLTSWTAGAKSPAILINKELRRRGEKLNKEILLWIKDNTDNRFIPNGSPI